MRLHRELHASLCCSVGSAGRSAGLRQALPRLPSRPSAKTILTAARSTGRAISRHRAGRRGHDSARSAGRRNLLARTTSSRSCSGIPGLEWKPKLSPDTQTLREMATETVFRRDIWCLEFTFKPVRMMWVDVPQASGKMQRKLIWYMVYHVKNTGKHLKPAKQPDGNYTIKRSIAKLRFFPQFVLEAHEYKKAYLDRLIPVAIAAIQQKKIPTAAAQQRRDSQQAAFRVSTDLVDHSVWGVATWEDVDPRIDFFSVFVQGLTNAYQWVDPPRVQAGRSPGQGPRLLQKTLMLNFWRPGDEYRRRPANHPLRHSRQG